MLNLSLKARAELMFRFAARSKWGKLQSLLGINLKEDGGNTEIVSIDDDCSVVSTRIAPWICLPDGRPCITSAITLFDQISTFAGAVPWDHRMRGGQSLTLQADVYKPLDLNPGDEVIFVNHKKRHGKVVSFIEAEMMNTKRETLAYLRHIRYQPMGYEWEVLGHPVLRPMLFFALESHNYAMPNIGMKCSVRLMSHNRNKDFTRTLKSTTCSQIPWGIYKEECVA
mmetsp:Transcript_49394/g.77186  ORF Transcript_49394/g.77186 Transcript_49394/m.77186 type:complete len:226 (+) Transcript_49394:167-844(+)